MHGIDYLLSPIKLDKFLRDYHGKKALYIEGANEKFQGLFGWDDVNNLLNYGNISPPDIRLIHNTENIPANAMENRNMWLSKGATLVINSVQKVDPLVDQFINILSSEMNTQVNVNCYSSFPEKQGFDLHFDFHDVFIIQLEGKKSWKVYEPTLTYPTEKLKQGGGARNLAEMPTYDPYIEVDMTEGDVMYIPRGHWHYALSMTPSIHLTVGPQARSPSHFLRWLTRKLEYGNEYFRRDFPIIDAEDLGGRIADSNLQDSIEEFRTQLRKELEDDSLMDQFIEFIMTENKLTRQHNVELPTLGTMVETFNENTIFEFPVGQKALVKYDPDEKQALIDVRGYKIELNYVPVELLKTLFDGRQQFTGNELMESNSDCKWEDVKNLLLTLFQQNVLRLADSN